jgi:hypothetical protein
MVVTGQGLEPVVKDDITLKFPFRGVVELLMKPAAPGAPSPQPAEPAAAATADTVTLRGQVTEPGVGPLGDVLLRFVSAHARADPRLVRSAADGSFDLGELAAGTWKLEARSVGFLTLRAVLEVRNDGEIAVLMVRQPADYDPLPLDLMPLEEPVRPPGLGPEAGFTDPSG